MPHWSISSTCCSVPPPENGQGGQGPLQADYRENRGEPAESLVVKNNLANQYELPVLFYACCILLYMTEADNLIALVLAWIFVALRYAHAFVHVTTSPATWLAVWIMFPNG
jgi:hypothetical protein